MSQRLIIFVCLLLGHSLILAESEGVDRSLDGSKVVRAVKINTSPLIDGRLNDPQWQRAEMIEDFHEVRPNEYAEPSEKSRVYVLYGEDALYIGARLYDREPGRVLANILRHGEDIFADDSFFVIIDTFNSGRSGYQFELNPNGMRAEGLFTNTTAVNWNWSGIWNGRASIDDSGWVAEFEIPYKTLSFNAESDQWGINFGRSLSRKSEMLGWVSRNREQNPSASGKLSGIKKISQGLGVDLVTGLSVRTSKDYLVGHDKGVEYEPSLDLFYKPSSALTVSLTMNTDFSGAEVDTRQVNLTRFGLFFPEKRGFFLQDSDIFEFGNIIGAEQGDDLTTFSSVNQENGRPFFSRSIGIGSTGEPIDLVIGGKLTGRLGRFDVGVLNIVQDEFAGIDKKDLFVARVSANVLEESRIGAIVTNGDPSSNLNNNLVGVDFRYLNTSLGNDTSLEGAVWFQKTNTEGVSGDDSAFGFSLEMPNSDGFRGGIGYKSLQENFNPALGFADRVGIKDSSVFGGYTHRFDSQLVRQVFAGLDVQRIEDADGNLENQMATFRLSEVELESGDAVKLHYVRYQEQLAMPFEISEGVVVPVGRYDYSEWGIDLSAARHRPLSGYLVYFSGTFFAGDRENIVVGATWRPTKHFQLDASYDFTTVELPEGSFVARLINTRVDIAFNAEWSWSNLVQYDNISNSIGLNSRLKWAPVAGNELLFVYNWGGVRETGSDVSFMSTHSDMTMKLGYTFRF